MRFSSVMTSEQAGLLYNLGKEHRAMVIARTSFGIYDGLLVSLSQIDRSGGALLRDRRSVLDYGDGLIEAAIIPASTYIAWPGVASVPGAFLEPVGTVPDLRFQDLSWRSVSLCRARDPVVMVPLPPVVVSPLPLR